MYENFGTAACVDKVRWIGSTLIDAGRAVIRQSGLCTFHGTSKVQYCVGVWPNLLLICYLLLIFYKTATSA